VSNWPPHWTDLLSLAHPPVALSLVTHRRMAWPPRIRLCHRVARSGGKREGCLLCCRRTAFQLSRRLARDGIRPARERHATTRRAGAVDVRREVPGYGRGGADAVDDTKVSRNRLRPIVRIPDRSGRRADVADPGTGHGLQRGDRRGELDQRGGHRVRQARLHRTAMAISSDEPRMALGCSACARSPE